MTELVAFLGRMLDADEQVAKAATPGPWDVNDEELAEAIYTVDPDSDIAVVAGSGWGGEVTVFNRPADAIHIARHDPARTLAKVAAERRILDAYRDAVARRDYYARDGEEPFVSESRGFVEALEMVIRRLAEVYQAEERTDG